MIARDNAASQAVYRRLGFEPVQAVTHARVMRRWGWQLPFSDRPRFGPCSVHGRYDR